MLVGYAAVFNSQSEPLPSWGGDFVEIIAPGAFNDAVQADDVRCLRDHQPGQLLGRTGAGTLRLSVDEIGLRYECDLPDTSHGRDTAVSVARADLAGNSFGFDVVEDEWDVRGPVPVRTLKRVKLYDVGPVTFPAYKGTSVDVRSLRPPADPTPPPPAAEPTPPARSARVAAEIRARRLRLAEAGA